MIPELRPVGRDIRHLLVRPPDVHPGRANGVINVARKLALEQRAAGERARLMMIAHAGFVPDADGDALDAVVPTEVFSLAGVTIGGRVIRLRRDVVSALLSDITDTTIFHIHGGREPLLASFGRALRRRAIPYAVTLHGRYSHLYDSDGQCHHLGTALYLKLFESGLLEGARFVQALSHDEAKVLRRISLRARIEVVGNGAYSSRYETKPVVPVARAPSASWPHFVYCGRYAITHKGLDLLIEGFARYRNSGGTGRLTTIGTGPEREALVSAAERLRVADAVDIGGPLFGDDRDRALQRCDFFIMTSRFEGVPVAALEAALLGLPLIVTSGTGLREAVQMHKAGIVIESLTADGVCAAMHRAASLSEAAWTKCRGAAFGSAFALADWTAIATRLGGLYEARPATSAPVAATRAHA